MKFFSRPSSKNHRPEKRSFGFESLEQREMLSATPYSSESYESSSQLVGTMDILAADILSSTKITSTTITLSWDASKMNGLRAGDPFKIQQLSYVTDSKGVTEEKWTQIGADQAYNQTIGNGIYTCELTGLTPATEYTLRIAYGSTTLGQGYSESLTITTMKPELKSEALSSSSIKLSWNIAGKTGTYFQVYCKEVGTSTWNNIGKVRADGSATGTKTYTATDLEAGKEYVFYVQYNPTTAKTEADILASQEKTASTLFVLDTSNETTDTVDLSWEAALGGTNHVVQVCSGSTSPTTATNWSNATTKAIDGTTFQVTGLKENTSYYFRVRYNVQVTVDGKTETETRYTDVLSYSTPSSIKIADITDTGAKVSWTFTGKSGTTYYIQTSLTGEDGSWSDYSGANTTSQTYTFSKLDAGTTYYIRVRYTSASGKETWSAAEKVTTSVTTKLDSVTENSAKISWSIPNIKDGTKVNVQRCDSTLDPTVNSNWKTIAKDISDSTYTNNHLGSDKQYYYRVSYTDTEGETRYTIHVSALTSGTLTATDASIDAVKLDWNFTPKKVTVQIAIGENKPTNDAGWGDVLSNLTLDSDGGGCTVGGLKPGQYYHFRIIYTTDHGSEEMISTEVSIKTQSSNLVALETTDTEVLLRWASTGFDTPRANTKYVIYMLESSGIAGMEDWVAVATVPATDNGYIISNLLADTEYKFQVRYEGGYAGSSTLSVHTKPHALNVSAVTKKGGLLSWTFDTDKDAEVNTEKTGDGKGQFIVQYFSLDREPTEEERTSDTAGLWIDAPGGANKATQKSYSVTTMETGTTRYYRVVYTYRTDDPEQGEGASTWIVPLQTKYSAVATLTSESDIKTTYVGVNRISIQWDDKSIGSAQYTVQYRVSGGTWIEAKKTTSLVYDFSDLAAGTDYEFQILYGSGSSTKTLKATTGKYVPSLTSKEVGIDSASATFELKHLSSETDFVIHYRPKSDDESAPWSTSADTTSSGTTATFSVTGLEPETEYEFKVVYQYAGSSHETEPITVALSDNLMPSSVTASSVKLVWDAAQFPDKLSTSQYIVEWRAVGTTTWSKSSSLTASTTNYTVSSLAGNTEYEFRVQYVTSGNVTAYSSVKTVQTAPPSITAATPQFGDVKLTWTFTSVDGYVVQYKGKDNIWHDIKTVTNSSAQETTVDQIVESGVAKALESDTEYTFRLAYKTKTNGVTVYSNEVTITTPYGLRVTDNTLTSKSVTIQWDYKTDTVYKISYRENKTNDTPIVIGDIPATTKEYTISGLSPGKEYEIILTYHSTTDKTDSVVITTPKVVPETPTALAATEIKSNSCKLTWKDNSEHELAFYLEVTNNQSGVTGEKIRVAANVGTGTVEEALSGLLSSTSYTVKLYASNDEGNSAVATVTFTTAKVASITVATVKATSTARAITLNWTVKDVENVPSPSGYRVEYYDKETKLWYAVETVTDKTWTAEGSFQYGEGTTVNIAEKTAYQFRVVSLGYNEVGQDMYADTNSSSTSITTKALVVPTSLSAKSTITSATISFDDSKDTVYLFADKTHKIGVVEGKFTDWSKVDETKITWIDVPKGAKSVVVDNLSPATTYSYVVKSIHAVQGEVLSKPANFTTAKVTAPSTFKSGFNVTADNKFVCVLSWKETVAVTDDTTISYDIVVSATGKKDTYFTLNISASDIKTTTSGTATLRYVSIPLSTVIAKLTAANQDLSKLSALSFQVTTTVSRDGTVLGQSTALSGRLTLPKLV